MSGSRIITGQVALGDAEVSRFSLTDICAKINAANLLAGLDRIVLLPSSNRDLNRRVADHCRDLGIQVYLWHKILSDNSIIPDESELDENAWGTRGGGESGIFNRIYDSEEIYLFACPRNPKYNTLLRNRCAQRLADYDGLFIDTIGFPLPSFGLENFFTCFCPVCTAIEPRLNEWRTRALDLREHAASASNADFEHWGTMKACLEDFGLGEFLQFRNDSVTTLVAAYADLARSTGKGFGVDLVSPSLSTFAGHDPRALGLMADWVKPRVYFRVFGPSNVPVELYSLTMGLVAWGKRYTIPGVLNFIERTTGLKMPTNVHSLAQNYLSDDNIMVELNKANNVGVAPVHPGFECALHPDYNTGVDETSIKNFLAFTRGNPGLVLSWNLLYVPDHFLKIIGENL